MTAHEFISNFYKILPETPKKVTAGSAFLNYLHTVKPSLFKELTAAHHRTTKLDLYYDSSNLGNAIVFIIKNWDNYE